MIRKSYSIIFILFLLIFINSCANKFEDNEVQINKVIGNLIEKPYDNIIVIPGEGCGGCISSATYFVTENYESLIDVAIVFTGVQDTKLLKNQIGGEFLNKDNVYIDSNNFLMKREVRSSYPYTLKMNSSRVTDFSLFEEAYFLNSK